ncbi:polysaccharide deacetylase family protein [Clostridium bowmanii]|uniref:polysaccharide deacetylase family protein n=1 Tax=Clostridium bowmanii TaxID=132925 RepID=UPI001C0BEA5A|nr:polysaccharide deacetylase family protein [Clostridium bowmanii]MBU3189587.1 polysaccharide deacetylase family protein [Clostridium bowmanii]MCA1073570.1 polysaccharide deacetylase family protein [Clostridium bowmanii]
MKNSKLRILTIVSIIIFTVILTGYNHKIYSKVSAPNVTTTEPLTQSIKMTNIKLLGANVGTPKVPVLMYHSVTADKNNTNELKVSQSTFKAQLNYLKVNHYTTISLDQLYSHMAKHTSLPAKPVVITFDDGYEDNYTLAYPLLKANNQKATVFMIANCINTEGYLTSKQLKIMDKNNFIVESHTNNHDNLSKLSYISQLNTLKNSKAILEKLLSKRVMYVSYPFGAYNKSTANAVHTSVYYLGIGTDNGFSGVTDNYYTINRVYINAFYSMSKFVNRLTVPMK